MRRSSRTTPLPGLRRLPAVLALAIAFTGLAVAPSYAATDCTVYWTGDVSPYWDDAENWSDHEDSDGTDSHAAPDASDVACLATDPARSYIVVNNGVWVSVGAMRLNGADLYFYGPVTVGGVADSEVGFLAVQAPMTKAAGSTLDVRGTYYQGAALVANGTVNLHGASDLGGDITGDVHNLGSADVVPGATLSFLGLVNEGTISITGGTTVYRRFSGPSIINKGTITAGGPDTPVTAILDTVDNQGLIRVVGGWLNLKGLTNLADGILDGPGTLDMDGGTMYLGFNNPITENRATIRVEHGGGFYSGLGDLTSNAGTLDVDADLVVGEGLVNTGTVKVGARLTAPGYSQTAGTTVGTGGTLVGNATVTGGSVSGLQVEGDLSLGSDVTTKLAVHGDGDTNPLTATGVVDLAGTLQVTTDDGYTPTAGTTYNVASGASRTGGFARVDGELTDYYYYPFATPTTFDLAADRQPAILVVPDAESVSESAGSATFTIYRLGSRESTVDWATHDGTAVAGTDYEASSGTVTFEPGVLAQTVTVPLTDNDVIDGSRTFEVRLSNPQHGKLAPGNEVAGETITNDDAPQVSSVSGGPVTQGATNQLLTVHGAGFTTATRVDFSRVGLQQVPGSLVVVDDTTLTVRVKAAAGMRTGPIGTFVRTAAGDGSCVDCLSVVSRPVATSTSPEVLGAGASHQSLTVSGSGFVDGTAVTIAGAVVHATSYVSSGELRVTFSVPSARAPGAASLRVTNPDGGSYTCKTCASFVAGPKLDPATTIAGTRTKSQTVHLTGTGFVAGLTLTGPAGVTFTDLVVSPTEVTATMAVAGTTPIASGRRITVTNSASAGWGTAVGSILTVCVKTATSCG